MNVAQPLQDPRVKFPPSYLLGDARPEHRKGSQDSGQLYSTSLTGWPRGNPHAAGLCLASPMPHLLGASHTAGQILGDVSHLRFPGLCHHHHHHHQQHCHNYHQDDLRLYLRARYPCDQAARSGAVCDRGGGVLVRSVANSVPSFESAPLSHRCALPSFGGNAAVELARYSPHTENAWRSYRSRPDCDETSSIGRISQPPCFLRRRLGCRAVLCSLSAQSVAVPWLPLTRPGLPHLFLVHYGSQWLDAMRHGRDMAGAAPHGRIRLLPILHCRPSGRTDTMSSIVTYVQRS